MDLLADRLGKVVTIDDVQKLTGGSRNEISSAVTTLINSKWNIQKVGRQHFICYEVGKMNAVHPKGAGTWTRQSAPQGPPNATAVTTPAKPVTPEPQARAFPGVLQQEDLLEVIFVSRAGTIIVEDGYSNVYTATRIEV